MTARKEAARTEARRNEIKRLGMQAFLDGEPESACPYPPVMETDDPFSAEGWRRECWLCGWDSARLDARHGRTFAKYKQEGMCDEFCRGGAASSSSAS